MQKIAQNVGSSIDSLNAKILLMQNELSSLKVQNKGISDSLKTLNETLKTADIKTGFFTDQLAFQLFVVGIIFTFCITLLSIISWKGILMPLKTQITKQVHKDLINNKENTYKANKQGLTALFMINDSFRKYDQMFLNALSMLSLILNNNSKLNFQKDFNEIPYWLNKSKSALLRTNPFELHETPYDEIIDLILEIKQLIHPEYQQKIDQILLEFNRLYFLKKD